MGAAKTHRGSPRAATSDGSKSASIRTRGRPRGCRRVCVASPAETPRSPPAGPPAPSRPPLRGVPPPGPRACPVPTGHRATAATPVDPSVHARGQRHRRHTTPRPQIRQQPPRRTVTPAAARRSPSRPAWCPEDPHSCGGLSNSPARSITGRPGPSRPPSEDTGSRRETAATAWRTAAMFIAYESVLDPTASTASRIRDAGGEPAAQTVTRSSARPEPQPHRPHRDVGRSDLRARATEHQPEQCPSAPTPCARPARSRRATPSLRARRPARPQTSPAARFRFGRATTHHQKRLETAAAAHRGEVVGQRASPAGWTVDACPPLPATRTTTLRAPGRAALTC